MGLAGDIERVGYHAQEMYIVNDHGRRLAGFGTKVFKELTGGRYVTVARSELSRLLFEKSAGSAEVIFGDELLAIDERTTGVDVKLRRSGRRQFDLVIGADGLHSMVRQLGFYPRSWSEKQLGYTAAAFEVDGYRLRDEARYERPKERLGAKRRLPPLHAPEDDPGDGRWPDTARPKHESRQ